VQKLTEALVQSNEMRAATASLLHAQLLSAVHLF
jgi:hypothetical protein